MIELHPSATIEAVLLPPDPRSFYTTPRSEIEFDIVENGVVGDIRHHGLTDVADIRMPAYARGWEPILNRRSVSIVGGEDLDYIADSLHLDAEAIAKDAASESQVDLETFCIYMILRR